MTAQPFNLKTLEPWHEVNSILRRMKSLTVKAAGDKYTEEAVLSVDDEGGVVLSVTKKGGEFDGMKAALGMKKGKSHAAKARA